MMIEPSTVPSIYSLIHAMPGCLKPIASQNTLYHCKIVWKMDLIDKINANKKGTIERSIDGQVSRHDIHAIWEVT